MLFPQFFELSFSLFFSSGASQFCGDMTKTSLNLDSQHETPMHGQKLHHSSISPNCNSNSRKRKSFYAT